MHLLLTGATGFLGPRLVRLLKRESDKTLYALARSEESGKKISAMGMTPVVADLNDPESLQRALKGLKIETVFHLAAEIATQRNKRLLWQTNCTGTQNLYEAVRKMASLERFVFASTVVVGEAHGELLTEEKPLIVETEYGRTKQASEKMLLQACQKDGFPAVILRPSHIYGTGGWFAGIVRDLQKGLFRIPGNGENLWDVVHVDDVAAALVLAGRSGKVGEIYHVVDDVPTTMKAFFTEAARHLGKKKVGHVPVFLANWVKGRDPIRAATRSARSSNQKIKALGWNPRYPDFKTGLARVFQEMA
ncbi:MAG: NAD-dependent epimerase/dehydratase family protein [bacterium]